MLSPHAETFSFMKITHVNGPGTIVTSEEVDLLPNERSAFVECKERANNRGFITYNLPCKQMVQSLLTRVRMGRYDPQSSFAVMMEVKEKINGERNKSAHFQIVVRYINPANKAELVTRVITEALPTTNNKTLFFDGVSGDVLSVVLAKEAADRTMIRKAGDTERDDPQTIDSIGMATQTVVDNEEVELRSAETQKDLDSTIHSIAQAHGIFHTNR